MSPGHLVRLLVVSLLSAGLGLSCLVAEGLYKSLIPLGLDQLLPVPYSNVLTLPKVELGRKLFLDRKSVV